MSPEMSYKTPPLYKYCVTPFMSKAILIEKNTKQKLCNK